MISSGSKLVQTAPCTPLASDARWPGPTRGRVCVRPGVFTRKMHIIRLPPLGPLGVSAADAILHRQVKRSVSADPVIDHLLL